MKHTAESSGIDIVDPIDFFCKFGEHNTIKWPHRTADLGHEHRAERIEGSSQRFILSLQAFSSHVEALGHVDAVIPVADFPINFTEIGAIFDNPVGHCEYNVSGCCVIKCLHRSLPYRMMVHCTSTSSNSFSSLSSAMTVSVAPTISSDVK